MTTAEYSSGDNSNTSKQSKDKLAIYIIAGIAGFLLILVALLVMCFVKRYEMFSITLFNVLYTQDTFCVELRPFFAFNNFYVKTNCFQTSCSNK